MTGATSSTLGPFVAAETLAKHKACWWGRVFAALQHASTAGVLDSLRSRSNMEARRKRQAADEAEEILFVRLS